MSTLLAVVPRVFAGLPLICEQSPGDRAKPHIVAEQPSAIATVPLDEPDSYRDGGHHGDNEQDLACHRTNLSASKDLDRQLDEIEQSER